MVSKLGNHDVGQQPSGWDALVDDLSRNRCLDKRFAVIADPFATYMTLDGEHARCVIQLLTDIFTDAFQRAAAWAVSVVRFVMDQCGNSAGNAVRLGFCFFSVAAGTACKA